MQPTQDQQTQLFCRRLNRALDQMGLPKQLLARANMLAAQLDIAAEDASEILTGRQHPTLALVSAICKFTSRPHGYFLDHSYDELAKIAQTVRPLNAGQSFALSLPDSQSADERIPNDAYWSYFSAHGSMGYGVNAGDLIVHFRPSSPDSAPAIVGQLYLLGSKGEYSLHQCFALEGRKAVFVSDIIGGDGKAPPPLQVRLNDRLELQLNVTKKEGIDFAAEVYAVIRDLRQPGRIANAADPLRG